MTVFSKPPKMKLDNEIFIDDVDKLVLESYPYHEHQHPLFKKFGTRTGGYIDAWLYTDDWKNLSDTEKWKYVALCERYWRYFYDYLYHEKEYEEYKTQLKEWSLKNPDFLLTLENLESMEI